LLEDAADHNQTFQSLKSELSDFPGENFCVIT